MKTIIKQLAILSIILVLLLGACKTNVSHNQDGSFDVKTTISQQELQQEITDSLADPLVKDLTVSLQSGYVLVSGNRARLNDPGKMDALTFRLDLGVSDGQLSASISDAQLDGKPIEQNRLDHWNQTLANRIAIVAQKNPNGSLKSVAVTPDVVTMTWNVTKR